VSDIAILATPLCPTYRRPGRVRKRWVFHFLSALSLVPVEAGLFAHRIQHTRVHRIHQASTNHKYGDGVRLDLEGHTGDIEMTARWRFVGLAADLSGTSACLGLLATACRLHVQRCCSHAPSPSVSRLLCSWSAAMTGWIVLGQVCPQGHCQHQCLQGEVSSAWRSCAFDRRRRPTTSTPSCRRRREHPLARQSEAAGAVLSLQQGDCRTESR